MVLCPVPPDFANSDWIVVPTVDDPYTATSRCHDGYNFEDGETTRTYDCENNVWSPDFGDCSRKLGDNSLMFVLIGPIAPLLTFNSLNFLLSPDEICRISHVIRHKY